MVKLDIIETIEIPENVEVSLDGRIFKAKGEAGEVIKDLISPIVLIDIEKEKITLTVKKASKNEKRLLKTAKKHMINVMAGAKKEFEYKLKICSGHFPMSVTKESNKLTIKNFLGEKVPRHADLLEGAKVEINGSDITITSCNIETAGQTAANIERSTRIVNRDRRRFQDGIYITVKAGAEI
ncbi:50S ribosomal protein L6 [archaeon]|jgi:large subunit ribosomal protein L6|nr:50S ribosomal protein L6 [archaeon]